ncbi:hypothetical protein [uncultured Corynebacterium sp.]|uniref:hypothetical protein n=1 Tax=uncultured Corynebacterium sp. TaxID=159447 RepID=UPI00280399A8|nr:hypothetical protein [uncultured Corynebacterium sp.]
MKKWFTDNRSIVLAVVAGAVVALVLVVVANALVGRGSSEGADPGADGGDPIGSSAGTAAASTVAAVNSYVPGEDASPADAATRVIDRLSGKYLELARNPQGAPVPDQWEIWARNGDRVHAVAEPMKEYREPPKDAKSTVVPVVLEVFVWHADGEQTPLYSWEVNATMVREDGLWKLSDIEYVRSRT